jgi:hypothetical protein
MEACFIQRGTSQRREERLRGERRGSEERGEDKVHERERVL